MFFPTACSLSSLDPNNTGKHPFKHWQSDLHLSIAIAFRLMNCSPSLTLSPASLRRIRRVRTWRGTRWGGSVHRLAVLIVAHHSTLVSSSHHAAHGIRTRRARGTIGTSLTIHWWSVGGSVRHAAGALGHSISTHPHAVTGKVGITVGAHGTWSSHAVTRWIISTGTAVHGGSRWISLLRRGTATIHGARGGETWIADRRSLQLVAHFRFLAGVVGCHFRLVAFGVFRRQL